MTKPSTLITFICILTAALVFAFAPSRSLAQQAGTEEIDKALEEELLQEQQGKDQTDEGDQLDEPLPLPLPEPFPTEPAATAAGEKEGEAAGGEGRNIRISGVVVMNYVFENSSDSFTIKYRWDMKATANADTAVMKGDVEFEAQVDGPLAKWPTGECKLDVSIPKVPFELTYKKTSEEKGDLRLNFKKPITEDWSSKCTFNDTPGAKLETSGPPEKWLAKALEKARPPLRSIVIDVKDEETTTPLVISKETISDAPIGTMEIEGTASVTVSP